MTPEWVQQVAEALFADVNRALDAEGVAPDDPLRKRAIIRAGAMLEDYLLRIRDGEIEAVSATKH